MNPYTINPPESEVVFEELCLALLKRHWKRQGLERFGKKGERQFGVDILDMLAETPMYAAQCKLKEQWKSLEPSEIREEVGKAEAFPGVLDHYAILTTGKVSTQAQLEIRTINRDHAVRGLFKVELFTWDKITKLLREYHDLEQAFLGGFRGQEVAEFRAALGEIQAAVTISASGPETSISNEIDLLIDEARGHIRPGEAQIAIMLLNKVTRTKGAQLSEWHRFRIHTNLGAANLILGKADEASRSFLEAVPLRPDNELAVANEVLAYHLLLQEDTAKEKAAAANKRFPNSARIWSLYLQTADIAEPYSELLTAIPRHLRTEGDVASGLARRAMRAGLIKKGIEHAKAAVADKPEWTDARLLFARMSFTRAVLDENVALSAEEKQRHLDDAVDSADAAIAMADTEDLAYARAQAFALKADIAHVLGKPEDVAKFAREAYAADATDASSQLAMAQAALAQNNPDECIRILEQALQYSKNAPNTSFMLGQALMSRGKQADLVRAIEVFASANLTNLAQELIDPITIGAVRAMVRSDQLDQVPAYLSRPEVARVPSLRLTLEAFAALSISSHVPAKTKLDQALTARLESDTRPATDFLARTLLEAGRLTEALPILQQLFRAHVLNSDVGLLLNCASRLGEDGIILQTCEVLYERGIRDWDSLEFEVQYLEEYDPTKAISRLEEFVSFHPEHAVARLRLAIVKMRFGKEVGRLDADMLPTAETLPMRYVVAAIHVLQWQDQGTFAVDYAYRVLRANPGELEAHTAYLASLNPGARSDIPAELDEVAVGAAVQYTEQGSLEVRWVVVEDTAAPNTVFEEVAKNDALAFAMLGKRVGDTFVLAKSPIKDRIATITQILSKYTRRYQAIGDRMEIIFPEQSVIHTFRIPRSDTMTAEDMQPILDSVQKQAESVLKIREIYKEQLIPIAAYGAQLGHNSFEALQDLAVSATSFVRCAHPQMDVFTSAMSSLITKNTVVIDLVALGSLRLLGITRQVLTSGARFVLTPSTFTALQQLRAKSRFSMAHGTMFYEDGQHYFHETTQDQTEARRASFEEWMRCVEENTATLSVPEVAALDPKRRGTLEQLFGRDGLESAILALAPGSILWTDDLALAEVSKQEFGTERIWTQVALESLATRGLLDRSTVDECHAKLLGFGYQATHFTGGTIIAALRVSGGSTEAFPMKQAVEAFQNAVENNLRIAFGQLADFVMRLSLEPMLPETKCLALEQLLNCFQTDATTLAQLVYFRDQCAVLMTLDPLGRQRFLDCFDRWLKSVGVVKTIPSS